MEQRADTCCKAACDSVASPRGCLARGLPDSRSGSLGLGHGLPAFPHHTASPPLLAFPSTTCQGGSAPRGRHPSLPEATCWCLDKYRALWMSPRAIASATVPS